MNEALTTRKISSDWQTGLARFGALFSGLGALLWVAVGAAGFVSAGPSQRLGFVPALVIGILLLCVCVAAWQLADEVIDCGDAIVVRKGRREQRIALGDIDDIHVAMPSRPPTIAICLKAPGPFGSTVRFLPLKSGLLGYSTSLPSELMSRVRKARAG